MSTPRKQPFFSVVVITYNGASTIKATLASLLAQDYPTDDYEIIVVDDCSTDSTPQILTQFKHIRYVRLPQNGGISQARNAGLKVARGTVYVCFDDDCVAQPSYLAELAKGYTATPIAGVGGRIAHAKTGHGLVMRYISAGDTDISSRLVSDKTTGTGLMARLIKYVSKPAHFIEIMPAVVAVSELYGATSSFPVKVLRAVGGWSEVYRAGMEDRDISARIRQRFQGHAFYLVPTAQIIHDRGQTLRQYLLRPYRRGAVNLSFYRDTHTFPPLFPFPVVTVFAVLATALLAWPILPVVMLAVPQLLYFWWPNTARKYRDATYLCFPYIQLAEETMVIAGIVRGFVVLRRTKKAAYAK